MQTQMRWLSGGIVLLMLFGFSVGANARTGNRCFTVIWPAATDCATPMTNVLIQILTDEHGAIAMTEARRADEEASTAVGVTNVPTGTYFFRATAYGPQGIHGDLLAIGYGQVTITECQAPPVVITAIPAQCVTLRILPQSVLIFTWATRHLYPIATNADNSYLLMPTNMVWTTSNEYIAAVDRVTGLIRGGSQDGNATVTVTNCGLKLSASTLVRTRSWYASPYGI